jgi:hypothetical protein
LKASNPKACITSDSISITIKVKDIKGYAQSDDEICVGNQYTLNAFDGVQYEWRSEQGFYSTLKNPIVNPLNTTKYYVTITDDNGCVKNESVKINVVTPLVAELYMERDFNGCDSRPSVRLVNQTSKLNDSDIIILSLGDGTVIDKLSYEHQYSKDGLFTIKLTAIRKAGTSWCASEKTQTLPVFSLKVPNVITPAYRDGKNDTFIVQYGGEGSMASDYGYKVNLLFTTDGVKLFIETMITRMIGQPMR